MIGNKVVIDTSVYVDYLRSGSGIYKDLVSFGKFSDYILYTPTIVILELFAGKSAQGALGQEVIRRIINPTTLIDLTRQIAQNSGELLRNSMVLDSEDAIIASVALYLDAELVTLNKKHFTKVPNLKIYNSKKI